jgi:hypothetical protein
LRFAAIADNVVSRVWSEGRALSNHGDEKQLQPFVPSEVDTRARDGSRLRSNRTEMGTESKRPTIKDVAREAGVSFKTVSRVMNRDARVNAAMREAVEAAMVALGYRPHRAARALRGNRTYAIALLAGARDEPLQGGTVPFPEYLGEVIAGCIQTCRPAGFHLVVELLGYGDAISTGCSTCSTSAASPTSA